MRLQGFQPLFSADQAINRGALVFVPKYRRKVMFGEIRKFLGPVFHELARQKESRIVEGHLMPDHVHMCIEIPPKYAVSSVVGFMKGKSAIAIAREFKGKTRNYSGESFWREAMRYRRLDLNWMQ